MTDAGWGLPFKDLQESKQSTLTPWTSKVDTNKTNKNGGRWPSFDPNGCSILERTFSVMVSQTASQNSGPPGREVHTRNPRT